MMPRYQSYFRRGWIADDVDLLGARGLHAGHRREHLVGTHRVAARVLARGREGAELAVQRVDAEVRRVQVPVDVEVDLVAVLRAVRLIGQAAEREEVLGLEERQRIRAREALAGGDLGLNGG
jgi:hypothetical protein